MQSGNFLRTFTLCVESLGFKIHASGVRESDAPAQLTLKVVL